MSIFDKLNSLAIYRGNLILKLFDEFIRTDDTPIKHNETIFAFYNRNAWETSENIRNLINEWYDKYPANEKDELKSSFYKSFNSSFYELFLNQFFKKLGFSVKSHPKLDNINTKPDFYIKNDYMGFYLEARDVEDVTKQEKSKENFKHQFEDLLNKTNSPNFFFLIKEVYFKSHLQPSYKKIIEEIESQISKFDPDTIKEIHPIIKYEDDKLLLEMELIPKLPHARNKGQRPIGVLPIQGKFTETADALKSALKKKASKYGKLNQPFIISLNYTSMWGVQYDDIEEALFGTLHYVTSNTNFNEGSYIRSKNGFYYGPKGPQNTRVSAVMITNVFPSNLNDAEYWIYINPFSEHNINFDRLGLKYSKLDNNRITTIEGKKIKEILSITDTWPN